MPQRRIAFAAGLWFFAAAPRVLTAADAPTPSDMAFLRSITGPAETAAQVLEEDRRLAEHVAEAFPADPSAFVLLGNMHRFQNRSEQAVFSWRRSLELDPNQGEAYLRLGSAAYDRDEVEQAIAWWEQWRKRNPQSADVHFRLAEAACRRGRYAEAIPLLRHAIALEPNRARYHYLLGQAFFQLERHAEAAGAYRRALNLSPDYAAVHYGLGRLYFRLKRQDKANLHLTRYRELRAGKNEWSETINPMDTMPEVRGVIAGHYVLASQIYARAGRSSEATHLLNRAVELDPENAGLHEKLALDHVSEGRAEAALMQFIQAAEFAPNVPRYLLNAGKIAMDLERFAQAETCYRAAAERFPNLGPTQAELARFYLITQTQMSEALDRAIRAVQLDQKPKNFHLLGWAQAVNGNLDEACSALETAINLAPDNESYRILLDQIRKESYRTLYEHEDPPPTP